MASSPLWPSLAAALALFSLGCRQEMPQAPPTPTTSTAPTRSSEMATSPAAAPSAPASGIGGTTGKGAEDAIITGKVKADLLKATDGKAIEIDVETHNGVVRLTGFARSNSDIDTAVEVAKRVEGVKNVEHKLAVKPS